MHNPIRRFIDWVLGNGYDLVRNETEMRQRKDETLGCLDQAKGHFSAMQKAFDGVPEAPEVNEEVKGPFTLDPT